MFIIIIIMFININLNYNTFHFIAISIQLSVWKHFIQLTCSHNNYSSQGLLHYKHSR